MIVASLLLAAALLLVGFGSLISAIDAALAVSSRSDLQSLAEQSKHPSSLEKIAEDVDTHANALTFIRVVAETAAAVLATVAFAIFFDNIWWAMLAALALMTVLTFVLVGASPRVYGRKHAEAMMRVFARLVRALRILLGPLAKGSSLFGSRVTPGMGRSSFTSEEQLLSLVDEAASNALIEEDDRSLIHSVFDFTDRFVRAVMVPRTDMVTVDATATMSEAMEIFLERGVSRMPVVDDDADDVVGVLYLKDLVQFAYRDDGAWREEPIRSISRPATFVPESMRAETLLQQMKRDAVHVCLVVDEYGGIAGLVTLEDLIEELVGEIADEYDHVSTEIVTLGTDSYRVSARLPLDEVGDLFGIELEDEDVDSIGGLLAKTLGQVPQPGVTAIVQGLVLTGGASKGRGRGIATVFVDRAPAEQERNDD